MNLGAFSISLTVKDIKKSQAFYQELGFSPVAGSDEDGFLIIKNGNHVIGLFRGMFDRNILTFNPGWDQDANNLPSFTDVRALQAALKEKGFKFVSEVEDKTTGPGSFMIIDPDGNPVLFDQHR